MDADYADDLVLLPNRPSQAESLLHTLEKAVWNIGLYVNSNKTGYMCFEKKGDISALNCKPLKLVEQFTYLVSNISSTEINVNTQIGKAWSAIN